MSTAHAKIDVHKKKISLNIGNNKVVFKGLTPISSTIKPICVMGLRERMELDLEARLMGETLILNKSRDPRKEDYEELIDLNEPLELRRNYHDYVDVDFEIEEGEIIDEAKFDTRIRDVKVIKDYPSFCDLVK